MKDDSILLLMFAIGVALYTWLSPAGAKNLQASESSCEVTWSEVKAEMANAKSSEGVDRLYYTQIAHMNLDTMLAKGCCKYGDTCPILLSE